MKIVVVVVVVVIALLRQTAEWAKSIKFQLYNIYIKKTTLDSLEALIQRIIIQAKIK